MAGNRARAAKVDLKVGTGRARADLMNFAKDAKRHLGDIGSGSYYGKGIFQSRGALWRDRAGRAGRAAGRGARAAGGLLAGGALGVAAIGGLGVLSMADDVYQLEKALTRFEIATNKTPEQMGAFREELSKVSRHTAINREELLKGAAAYVALTGDAAGAAQGMATFAKVQNATGASMEDIAATAAAMKDNLKIDPKDFEAAFSALHVQGKAGAVELRELASELAGIAPTFADFKGGGGVDGLVEMGAALQVIRKGFGSSNEAATGMQSLMVSLKKNAGKFQKAGVKIYDKDPKTGKKRLKDFSDIIDGIAKSKLAKDPTLLQKAFGRDEAVRAYDQLVKNRALMDSLIKEGSNTGAIDADAQKYLASDAGRIAKAWEGVKLKMAEAFTPERIEKFAAALEKAVMFAADMVDLIDQILNFGDDSHDSIARTHEGVKAGMSTDQALQLSRATSTNANMMRDIALGSAAPLSQDEMLKQFYGRGDKGAQAYLQLQEIGKRSILGGQSIETATRQVTGGDAALQRTLAEIARIQTAPIIVKIDGAPVARAAGNASVHTTRPGGV